MHNFSLGKRVNTLVMFITLILLNSCLTINSEMRINGNGSGSIAIEYILESGLNGISTLGSNNDIVPLNLSENHIIEMIGGRDDIVYKDYKTKEDINSYTVNVTFLFDNIEALNSILPEDNAVSLVREGNETVFRQGIITKTDDKINDISLEILQDIYKEHTFTIEVRVPSEIIDVENGNKVESRKAVYSEKFLDIITSADKKEWSIRW